MGSEKKTGQGDDKNEANDAGDDVPTKVSPERETVGFDGEAGVKAPMSEQPT